jgi:hypothetical protein
MSFSNSRMTFGARGGSEKGVKRGLKRPFCIAKRRSSRSFDALGHTIPLQCVSSVTQHCSHEYLDYVKRRGYLDGIATRQPGGGVMENCE